MIKAYLRHLTILSLVRLKVNFKMNCHIHRVSIFSRMKFKIEKEKENHYHLGNDENELGITQLSNVSINTISASA